MDEANEIIEDLLNEQSALLWEWRSKILSLLTQKLSAGEDEADGQEYARTLDTQGEAEAYLQAYSALLADRREVLVAERTLLAAHDVQEKKLRHTKAAMRAAAAAAAPRDDIDISDVVELQPEHEVLHKELSDTRKALLAQFTGRAVKSVMVDLSGVAAKIQRDSDPEKAIAQEGAVRLRRLIKDQGMWSHCSLKITN
jgi:E3 ubiquitin-protein ligase SHPRH